MKEDKDKKERGEVSRRDFLVGAGAVVVGGAIGAGITYPLVSGDGEVVTTTSVKTVPTTVTTTKTVGDGAAVTVTDTVTTTVGAGETVTKTVPTTVTTTVGDGGAVEPAFETEETFIKGLGLLGFSLPHDMAHVDVKNNKIIRIRPIHWDEHYDLEELNHWKIDVRGKVLDPGTKTLLCTHSLVYKNRVYSPNRVKYALKRVDWDPNGERNPQNRGKSKFVRISPDEATTIIANEIQRVHNTYGPYAIFAQGDGHGESKVIHAAHGCQMRLLGLIGGFTQQIRNPDSWEGWFWGAEHVWGMDGSGAQGKYRGGKGQMQPQTNVFYDEAMNTELFLCAGSDRETTPWGDYGQIESRVLFWHDALGIKSVYICPDLNYAAAIHADKWIPILPGQDAAWLLAVMYTWIDEDTYEKDYVDTHTYGFDDFKDYVMGTVDGIPKTPKWASTRCGAPPWTIKALARAWASKNTCHHTGEGGSMIRGPYNHEPARLMVYALAMQAVGKPGRHQHVEIAGVPRPSLVTPNTRAYARSAYTGAVTEVSPQHIAKTMIPKCLLNPPQSWYCTTASGQPVEDQFVKYTYPIPEEDGGTEVHMIWCDVPCLTTCWDGYFNIEGYRSSTIECMVVQHPWMENDTMCADIILPVSTKLEQHDICGDTRNGIHHILALEEQAITPIGDSKSDYDWPGEVAKKLEEFGGIYADAYNKYTEGRTVEEWAEFIFEKSGVTDYISWDELKEQKYFVCPTAPNWEEALNEPAGMAGFYEDPDGDPLHTKSGKIEFYAQWLAENFPNDKERPPVAQWVIGGDSPEWYHNEAPEGSRGEEYPLLVISNHGRWKEHANFDDATWLREIPTSKVKGSDGYLYEPIWIHPTSAEARGIQDGDIVKMYNERGICLGGARVTNRIHPGAAYQDHGARIDLIAAGPDEWIDRGGANNMICPENIISKNATGMVCSAFLVEIKKVTGDEMEGWRRKYPEAFSRAYEPDSGLRFEGWIEGGTQ